MRTKWKNGWLTACLLATAALSETATAEYFQPLSGGLYHIGNEFSGMVMAGYLTDLVANHWVNDENLRTWEFEPTGTAGEFYLKQVQYPGYAYVWNGDARLNYQTPQNHTNATYTAYYRWVIEKVTLPDGRDPGFYSIKNVGANLYLTFDIDTNNTPNLRAEKAPIEVMTWTGDRRQLWTFMHTITNPIECLSIPEGGWDVSAPNKCAVLNLNSQISAPSFSVSGPQSLSGTAVYWGQYWNGQYFYVINLNGLSASGTYTLSCNGKSTTFRIANNVFASPFRDHGAERFNLTDLFDNQWGFVGHWGHNTNWWPKGKDSTQTPGPSAPGSHVFYWRDPGNANQYDNPAVEIGNADALRAFSGGWDMTDQESHEWAKDGDVVKDLVMFYDRATSSVLRAEIDEEIIYGAKGIMVNQDANGKWRQGIIEKSHWLGTDAKLGAGLAAAARHLASSNPTLSTQFSNSAVRAWNYVYANRNDRSLWAIKGEGKLPDGKVMTSQPQGHRHGYEGAWLDLAVEMYLLNGNANAKAVIDDIIARGKISNIMGQIQHISGGRFPGEIHGSPVDPWYNHVSDRGVLALLKYYDYADASQTNRINTTFFRPYYEYDVYGAHRLGGPLGMFENDFKGRTGGGQWELPRRVMIWTLLNERFGAEYGRGLIVAQRAFDYWTGCNPYATSLILGVGDEFQVGGWSSYQTLGRHVGLLALGNTDELHSSLIFGDKGYMARETTAGGGVQMWLGWMLLQKELQSIPLVTLYSDASYGGTKTRLAEGKYKLDHLKAYGLKANDLSSMRLPAGYTVTLYDADDYSGTSASYTSDAASLGGMNNKTESIKITYVAPPNTDPEIELRGNGTIIADGDTTPSTADDTAFGEVRIGSHRDRVFTINNVGASSLSIQSVSVSGTGFSVQAQPAGSVAAGGSTTFTIRFASQSAGGASGNVSFANGDADENPFNFAVSATGTTNRPPAFSSDPINASDAVSGQAYSGDLSADASDPDGDTLSYSKLSGPAWLSVASDGLLSGTPSDSDQGTNVWTVRVSDGNLADDASLRILVVTNAPFDPNDYGTCVLWLDGDDVDGDGTPEGSGESVLNGSLVQPWKDKSGTGRDATQTDSSKQASLAISALNRHDTVRFDATRTYSFTEIANARTVFWVVKENAGTAEYRFLLGHSSAYDFHRGSGALLWNSTYASANVKNGTTRLDGSVVDGTTTDLPRGDFHLISLVAAGDLKTDQLTADRVYGREWDGDIAEIIIYSDALSDADRQDVEAYLSNKWFVVAQSPADRYNTWTAGYSMGSSTNLMGNPDADDRNNLAEYALGGDPTDASANGYSPEFRMLQIGGSNVVECVHPRRKDYAARGLSYLLETATNITLGTWSDAQPIETGTTSISTGFDEVTNHVDAQGLDRLFLRLRIEYQP